MAAWAELCASHRGGARLIVPKRAQLVQGSGRNLDIGRPEQVSLIFDRRITRRPPGRFRTRVWTAGVAPSLRFDDKATRVKQYFKLERALRTETTINNANDFRVGKRPLLRDLQLC